VSGQSAIEIEEHLADVLAAVRPLAPIRVPLADALGRVLAADVVAAAAVPASDNSSMDGYAVRAADVAGASPDSPVELEVVAEVAAGSGLDPALAPGQAVRIMTGAPVPSDADTIVPVEDTSEHRARAGQLAQHEHAEHGDGDGDGHAQGTGTGTADHDPPHDDGHGIGNRGPYHRRPEQSGWVPPGERVHVVAAPAHGSFVRRAGSDLSPGANVLAAGTRLTPYRLGAAVTAGVADVTVRPAPRVAIIATGEELVAPGEPVTRGRLHDSNSVLLRGAVASAGGEVVAAIRVGDDPAQLLAVLDRLLAETAPDLVVCTGGVSVGAHDVVKAALAPGGRVAFRAVRMQPGKPQAFGVLDSGALCFGLPGNPVSVAVSFEVFVRPALQAMQGLPPTGLPRIESVVSAGWRTPPGRRQYMPIAFDADGGVRPATAGGSGSHLAGGLAHAEGFAIVAADVDEVRAGDRVPVMLVAS
jgi:molybdopterin molybdotransferase